jgi:hypothetical protein
MKDTGNANDGTHVKEDSVGKDAMEVLPWKLESVKILLQYCRCWTKLHA